MAKIDESKVYLSLKEKINTKNCFHKPNRF